MGIRIQHQKRKDKILNNLLLRAKIIKRYIMILLSKKKETFVFRFRSESCLLHFCPQVKIQLHFYSSQSTKMIDSFLSIYKQKLFVIGMVW